MKRIFCLLAVLLMCAGIVCPAYAAGNGFVPSVSRPEKPEIGNVILTIVDKIETGEAVDPCIVISTVTEAIQKTTDISQEERDLLVEIYEKITEGTMQLPIPKSYAVLQVLDVSWEFDGCVTTDHPHELELEQEDRILVADFDLGVEPGVEVSVLVYINDKWEPVEKVTNNGDGTVTCEFQNIGPVAFSVPAEEPPAITTAPFVPEPAEGPGYPWLWLILLIIAFLLFLLLVFLRHKRKKDEEENT